MTEVSEHDEKLLGSVVANKYRVDRLIGRGGMGAVFEATNVSIGKRVALKFLDKDAARDSESAMRFQREAEAASTVESAHIVHIFDSGTNDDGRPFLVMELLQGEDLRSVLRRDTKVPLPEAIHIIGQVLRALARAHAGGIVHRDLKPDNVFLCRHDDDPMFVKIVDFGISKVTHGTTANTLTRRGMVLGTAFYMSPEQAQAFRDIDGRTDLYSAGVILFEALAGRPPHIGSVYEAVLIDICTKDAPNIRTLVPDVPETVADVLTKALKRDRDERFQDAGEFYDALAMAAPGLLRTGGPGLGRSLQPSHPDTARIVPAQTPQSEDGRIPTAEGTAVRPSLADGRAQKLRTPIAMGVTALFVFAVMAIFFSKRAENRGLENGGVAGLPVTSASTSTVVPISSETADAGSTAPATSVATHPSGKSRDRFGTKPPPSAASTNVKTTPHPTGVATGLVLDQHGP
jgi:serine/threonine-protein kinase